MNEVKFHTRSYGTKQLEKFINRNHLTRDEIFSITPVSSYYGNGETNFSYHLCYFVDRVLFIDIFCYLSQYDRDRIYKKIHNIYRNNEKLITLKNKLLELSLIRQIGDGLFFDEDILRNSITLFNIHPWFFIETMEDEVFLDELIELNKTSD
jgi:hypothetical protein